MSNIVIQDGELPEDGQNKKAVQTFDPMAANTMAAFESGVTIPIDEIAESWQPEQIGESKRLLFIGCGVELFTDTATGAEKPTAKAYFVELRKAPNGSPYLKRVKMGTIETVSTVCNITKKGDTIVSVTPKAGYLNTMWDVTLTGSRKSKTNGLNKISTFSMNRVVIAQ
jgi:hypothetical protein